MKKFMCSLTLIVFVLSSILFVSSLFPSFSENNTTISKCDTNTEAIKRIVSIVYDDSRSMGLNGKVDYTYASYSLQNFLALMNKNDEVAVTKMSKKDTYTTYSLSPDSTRQSTINDIAGWKTVNGTPFGAVDTAANWLKSKKSANGDSQLIEYWLVVLTDGMFETGYPASLTDYLNNLKSSMGSSKFEGVLVAMGNEVPDHFKNDWNNVLGNVFTANGAESIVSTMSSVSTLIYGIGSTTSVVDITKDNDSTISFNLKYPARKIIIFEQNQGVEIKSIKSGNSNFTTQSIFTTKLPKTSVNSKVIHLFATNNTFAPSGKVSITFNNKIDTSENNFKVLIEYGIKVNLSITDINGSPYDKNRSLYQGDNVKVKACVFSVTDCSNIDLDSFKDQVNGTLFYNSTGLTMNYDGDGCFSSSVTLNDSNNSAYATIELPGYFKNKSDTLELNEVREINGVTSSTSDTDLNISYKYVNEYETVSSFDYCLNAYGVGNEEMNVTFNNLPKGIRIVMNGVESDSNKLTTYVNGSGCTRVELKRNKDFDITDATKVTIDSSNSKYKFNYDDNSKASFTITPVQRNITMNLDNQLDKELDVTNFDGEKILLITPYVDGEYMTKEEMKESTLTFKDIKGLKYDYEIVDNNGHNSYEVTINKDGLAMFADTGKQAVDPTLETKYHETATEKYNLTLKDNIVKYLPLLLLLLLGLLILGYLPGIKHRLQPSKYYIKHTTGNSLNADEDQIVVNKMSRILPYVSEKGTAGGLEFYATGNNNKIKVVKPQNIDMENVYIDGSEAIFDKSNQKFDAYVDSKIKFKDNGKVVDTYEYLTANYE